jgi:hypothetical protein
MYFQVQPTIHNVTQCIYFCEMLCVLQAGPPHVIWSSKLCTQHRVLVKLRLLPAVVYTVLSS